jgi:hypothetical protein
LNTAVSDADLATLDGTEILTGKTIDLTNNVLVATKAQLNNAVSDANVATIDGTETLTGKTISAVSNTVTDIPITSLATTGTRNNTTVLHGDYVFRVPAVTGGPGPAAPAAPYELVHDFSNDANGLPVTADTGQLWTRTYNRVAGNPIVASGAYTNTDTASGVSASYLSTALLGSATYMAADFSFGTTGSTDGQNAVLAAWTTALPSGAIGTIPDSPCHCVFTRVSCHYAVWDAAGSGLDYVGEYFYPVQPGTGVQHVEIVIDRPNATAHVLCPDGQVIPFYDPRIATMVAPNVTAEIYYPAANTGRRVNFTKFAADSSVLTSMSPSNRAAIGNAQIVHYVTKTASYTVSIEDNGRNVLMNSSSALNFTIPPNSTVGFPIGTVLAATQLGTGQVTLVPGAGVTLPTATSLKTRARYSTLSLEQIAVDVWLVGGDAE